MACNYHIWALRHIRHLLSQNVAHNFAGPEQSCRNLIIAMLCCTALRKLLLRCCREFRIISFASSCCRKKYASASQFLQSLHWLPIDARISFKLAVITYKVRSTNTPVYLSRILSEHSTLSSMVLRSASRPLLSVRRLRTEHGRSAFHRCPTFSNSLPTDIQLASSLNVFKKRLQTLLFATVYNK